MSNHLDEAAELIDALMEVGSRASANARLNDLTRIVYALQRHLRSHPAPPPSPALNEVPDPVTGEPLVVVENAGEASDEELKRVEEEARERVRRKLPPGPPPLPDHTWRREERRALYDLGKKHQASADAATVAGLRRVVDEALFIVRKRRTEEKRSTSAFTRVDFGPLYDAVDALPASLRPEPGGGK